MPGPAAASAIASYFGHGFSGEQIYNSTTPQSEPGTVQDGRPETGVPGHSVNPSLEGIPPEAGSQIPVQGDSDPLPGKQPIHPSHTNRSSNGQPSGAGVHIPASNLNPGTQAVQDSSGIKQGTSPQPPISVPHTSDLLSSESRFAEPEDERSRAGSYGAVAGIPAPEPDSPSGEPATGLSGNTPQEPGQSAGPLPEWSSIPTYQNVEIGGGRITGTEVTPDAPEGREFAMYSADQFSKPTKGDFSMVEAVDGSKWYKQYAAPTVDRTPYMTEEGTTKYHEKLIQALPAASKRKERI